MTACQQHTSWQLLTVLNDAGAMTTRTKDNIQPIGQCLPGKGYTQAFEFLLLAIQRQALNVLLVPKIDADAKLPGSAGACQVLEGFFALATSYFSRFVHDGFHRRFGFIGIGNDPDKNRSNYL